MPLLLLTLSAFECSDCNSTEFKCSVSKSQCIPMCKRCDGTIDCNDYSDELNCSKFMSCSTLFNLVQAAESDVMRLYILFD
jgi:Low-density lipoprotein receptor domain class A